MGKKCMKVRPGPPPCAPLDASSPHNRGRGKENKNTYYLLPSYLPKFYAFSYRRARTVQLNVSTVQQEKTSRAVRQ